MFRIRCVLLATVLALCRTLLPATEKDAEGGAFYTGQYRDLFAEIGHSPDESRARIDAAFQQLFHGDQQTQTLFYEVGGNKQGALAYITDIANHDVRTEGMSYGMMISVQMNRKHEFDALWNWANTYMLITDRKDPGFGYYKWSMNIDGSPHSSTPAPDGEEYFVMSLYFAANRWGSGRGLYNYKAQADRLLHLMRHHPVMTGSTHSGIRTIGPMVDEKHHMIRFVPDSPNEDFTTPRIIYPPFMSCGLDGDHPKIEHFGPRLQKQAADFSFLRQIQRRGSHRITPIGTDLDEPALTDFLPISPTTRGGQLAIGV